MDKFDEFEIDFGCYATELMDAFWNYGSVDDEYEDNVEALFHDYEIRLNDLLDALKVELKDALGIKEDCR